MLCGVCIQGHPYRDICTIRKGAESSLIELEFTSHQAHEAQAGQPVPAGMKFSTLTAQLQELQVVFLNRFVKEVTNYIMLLVALAAASKPAEPAESPKTPSVSASRQQDYGQQQEQQKASSSKGTPFVLQMDIKLAAPVITMPRSTDSSDSMQVDLGSLHLTNTVRFVKGSLDKLSQVGQCSMQTTSSVGTLTYASDVHSRPPVTNLAFCKDAA